MRIPYGGKITCMTTMQDENIIFCKTHDFLFGKPRRDEPEDDEYQREDNKVVYSCCPVCEMEDSLLQYLGSPQWVIDH